CIPVAIAFLMSRPGWKAVGLIVAVVAPALAATGYYNRAVTGKALEMPFTEYARQYVYIPLFNFQPLQSTKSYRTPVIFDLHQNWERTEWEKSRTLQIVPIRLSDYKDILVTVLGGVLWIVPLLLLAGNFWRDRRTRLPLICVAVALAGSLTEVRYYVHY